MAWRDNLLDGELDGVPFLIQSHEHQTGRRNAQFDFPGRDLPSTSDLGRDRRTFNLEVFVVEPNYMLKRDDLIDAAERAGPKLLVHPYLGEHVVGVENIRVSESTREGGIARIQLELFEWGNENVAGDRILFVDVPVVVDFMIEKVEEDFKDTFDADGFLDTLTTGLQTASSKLRSVKGKITAKLQLVDDLDNSLDQFNDDIASLLNTPQELASQLTGLAASVVRLATLTTDLGNRPALAPVSIPHPSAVALEAVKALVGVDYGVPSDESTPRRLKLKNNMQAISDLNRRAALAEAARALANLDYLSADQAVAALSDFTNLIRDETASAAQEVYTAAENLRASLSRHLTTVAQSLPRITTITLRHPESAEVIAYRLYGDASRGSEIADRNNVHNPLLIGPGDIEVLSS